MHSRYGRDQLVGSLGVDASKVRVIHHGAFKHLTVQADERPLPAELGAVRAPVVLFFGLLRPYKGLDVLLDAWRGIEGAELWIVGRPRMSIEPLRARAPANVRFVPRYVSDAELPAFFRRADVVVLPYSRTERLDQSGVLATALAFGKPTVVSDVGGFGEVAAAGAARLIPPGDPGALHDAFERLLGDPQEREGLARGALAAAAGPYSWQEAAGQTLALYRESGWIAAVTIVSIVFWLSVGLIVYAHAGYPVLLGLMAALRGHRSTRRDRRAPDDELPTVSVIVAAYAEEDVIAERVANIRALDYPPQLIELIVACDGSPDETASRAERRRCRPACWSFRAGARSGPRTPPSSAPARRSWRSRTRM